MKNLSDFARYALCGGATIAALSGCSAAGSSPIAPVLPQTAQNIAPPEAQHRSASANGYVYVANRTVQGTSELVVYRLSPGAARPIRRFTGGGLVDARGVAVDADGNVFVANGSAANVLEFTPGATALVRTFSKGLVYPMDVAVSNETLYVADRGNSENGYAQQIMEFSTADGSPITAIGGLGDGVSLNASIATSTTSPKGTFFAGATSIHQPPPKSDCRHGSFIVAENIFPTLWVRVPLRNNRQVSAIAFDSNGQLYASDPCTHRVDVYALKHYTWTYSHSVAAKFGNPLFLTIDGPYLAVPSAASDTKAPGFVTVVNLETNALQVIDGLTHPFSAAVGFDAAAAR